MLKNTFFALLFFFLSGSLSHGHAAASGYEGLNEQQKHTVDTILDEFKKNRLLFLQELSDINSLQACTAVVEGGGSAAKKHADAPHEGEHEAEEGHEEEHLAARVISATPDEAGNYQPPIFKGPEKTYTYKELYTVAIAEKTITVTVTTAAKGNPSRQEGRPDRKFLQALATRLSGQLTENRVVLP